MTKEYVSPNTATLSRHLSRVPSSTYLQRFVIKTVSHDCEGQETKNWKRLMQVLLIKFNFCFHPCGGTWIRSHLNLLCRIRTKAPGSESDSWIIKIYCKFSTQEHNWCVPIKLGNSSDGSKKYSPISFTDPVKIVCIRGTIVSLFIFVFWKKICFIFITWNQENFPS